MNQKNCASDCNHECYCTLNYTKFFSQIKKIAITSTLYFIKTLITAIFSLSIYLILIGFFIQTEIQYINYIITQNKDAFIAFGGILTVMTTLYGVYVTVGYRIKVEVLSKNRQEWINDLRKNMAEFLEILLLLNKNQYDSDTKSQKKQKLVYIYHYVTLLLTLEASKKQDNNAKNLITTLNNAAVFIISPEDYDNAIEDYEDTLASIGINIHDYLDKNKQLIINKFQPALTSKLSEYTQIVLKTEWERVKDGQ